MKQVNQVYKTNDYGMFKYMNGNRNINKANLKRLIKSMKERYIPVPIIVNEKNEIIDGQHRFEAANFLGFDVHFIKIHKLALDEVRRLNENMSNWTNANHLHSFCELGHPEYLKFRQFMQETGYNYSACIALLSGSPSRSGEHGRRFKFGTFKIKNYTQALEHARMLDDIGKFYPNYKKTHLMTCMMKLLYHPDYDHKRMLQKLAIQKHLLPAGGGEIQYKEAIVKIFNYKVAKNKMRAFF